MLLPAGVGLMAFESHVGPPVAAFPLPALAPTDLDDADMCPPNVITPGGFRGCHYIMAAGRELWHKAYRCLSPPRRDRGIAAPAQRERWRCKGPLWLLAHSVLSSCC